MRTGSSRKCPLLEESGVLVRLPDWWRKRPKPRVNVTIGDKKKSRFGADTMLDFNVELALGDQKLTEREWRELLAGEDGLVRLKGQWVEVDREQDRRGAGSLEASGSRGR